METADNEKELLRLQGEVFVLKIIAGMPAQVQADLNRMAEEDRRKEEQRERAKAYDARPGVFSVKGT